MRLRRRLELLEARQEGFEHGLVGSWEDYQRSADGEIDDAYRRGWAAGEKAAKTIERAAERRIQKRAQRAVRSVSGDQ